MTVADALVVAEIVTGLATVAPEAGEQIVIEGAADVAVQVPLALLTVTVAEAEDEELAWLVAVTVCEPAVAGAVYSPVELTVPAVLFPPGTPSTLQFTAVLELPVTLAVNCCVPLGATVAEVGERVTVIGVPLATVNFSLWTTHAPL